MPRALARTSKGHLIGKGLSAQASEAVSKAIDSLLNKRRGKDSLSETQLLEVIDQLLELQNFHKMLEDGRIDELLDALEASGLLPSEKYPALKVMNGTNGQL